LILPVFRILFDRPGRYRRVDVFAPPSVEGDERARPE
jgi:hypothetical protein